MVHQVKTVSELQNKLKEAGNKLVVVDFFATWCGPCKKIAPIFEKIAEKYGDKLLLLKVDVDEVEELVGEYGIEVLPTFVFIRGGVTIDTLVSSNDQKLSELIENHLKDDK